MAPNIVIDRSSVLNLLQSNEQFPVDLEVAWQWLGYSRKDKVLAKLKNNFVEGLDFEFSTNRGETPQVGRPSDSVRLTTDCFKMLGMMAGTAKGREVRLYFLDCEKQVKASRTVPKAPELTPEQGAMVWLEVFKTFGLTDSPRHLQLAQDRVANLLGAKALPASTPKWEGVVEIAEGLGYKAADLLDVRSPLGRAVAAWYRTETGKEPNTERRLTHGRMTTLKVYQPDDEIKALIQAWLGAKGLVNLSIA